MRPDKRKGAAAIQAASRQPGSEARHQDAAGVVALAGVGPSRAFKVFLRSGCSQTQRQRSRVLPPSSRLRGRRLPLHATTGCVRVMKQPLFLPRELLSRRAAPLNHGSRLRAWSSSPQPEAILIPPPCAATGSGCCARLTTRSGSPAPRQASITVRHPGSPPPHPRLAFCFTPLQLL